MGLYPCPGADHENLVRQQTDCKYLLAIGKPDLVQNNVAN